MSMSKSTRLTQIISMGFGLFDHELEFLVLGSYLASYPASYLASCFLALGLLLALGSWLLALGSSPWLLSCLLSFLPLGYG
jgi:hypothetical protein